MENRSQIEHAAMLWMLSGDGKLTAKEQLSCAYAVGSLQTVFNIPDEVIKKRAREILHERYNVNPA